MRVCEMRSLGEKHTSMHKRRFVLNRAISIMYKRIWMCVLINIRTNNVAFAYQLTEKERREQYQRKWPSRLVPLLLHLAVDPPLAHSMSPLNGMVQSLHASNMEY